MTHTVGILSILILMYLHTSSWSLLHSTQGVENVYTRHKPLLAETLDQLVRGRLSESTFPYCGDARLADR